MKKTLIIIFAIVFNFSYSQTSNSNLNSQLQTMRKYFLEKKYKEFLNFTPPKVAEMAGGKEKLVQATEAAMRQIEKGGFSFLDVKFTNPSKFIKKGTETQFTITQEILMNTPKGKILGGTTLVGISNDNGKNWKFIDAAGKSKELMKRYFPNLSQEIVIKPKYQKSIE